MADNFNECDASATDVVARADALAAQATANTALGDAAAAQATANAALPAAGRTDASEPPAGQIGEVISSTVTSASAVNCPNNTVVDVTSIALTPGDWDVWIGSINFLSPDNATCSSVRGGISGTSATIPSNPQASLLQVGGAVVPTSPGISIPSRPRRFNVAVNTTVYLVARVATLAVGSIGAYGEILARRAS